MNKLNNGVLDDRVLVQDDPVLLQFYYYWRTALLSCSAIYTPSTCLFKVVGV
jgi:hypothetical protein